LNPPRLVLSLADVEAGSRPLVGGKAEVLATLARLGLPVPPAFVVTVEAYRGGMTPELRQVIREQLDVLRAADPARLIVRSSAPFEDDALFSAAGQLESVVCAPDLDSLLDAIQRCWAVLTRPELLSYYRQTGAQDDPALAVLVQVWIDTEIAGVLFTDGIGPPDTLVIEAAPDTSDGVTSGEVVPDRIVIDRQTRQVLETSSHLLDDRLLAQLVDLGLQVEAHYQTPQDIEWGVHEGRLYLFQARPVTASARASGDDLFTTPGGDDSITWVSGFFEERFPAALSPLTWTYLLPAVEQTALREPLRYLGVRGVDRLPMLRLVNGRVYTNLAVFQMLYKWFPARLVPGDARRFFPGGNVSLRHEADQPRGWRLVGGVLRTWLTVPYWHPWNYRAWRGFVRAHTQALRAFRQQLDADPDMVALIPLLEGLQALTIRLLRIHRWSLNYAEVFTALLARLITRWTTLPPEEVQTYLVSSGTSPTVETDRWLRQLAQHEGDQVLLDVFLAQFGHRSFSLDLMAPRYADDPAQVWAAARRLAGDSADQRAHERTHQRARLQAELDRQLDAAPIRRGIVHATLFFARKYVALREEQRFEWQKGLHLTRRVFVLAETRLIARGILRQPGDVFFLRWDEVKALLHGDVQGTSLAANVVGRRRAYRQIQHAPYPRFLQGDHPLRAPAGVESTTDLRGVGASAGQAVGTARVILTPRSLNDLLDHLCGEDILVTRATDPGWTPAFGQVRALVMSLGGQLSHGAIVAREYGIPAVVGLGDAVGRIQDGDRLLVDGTTGTVTLLDAADSESAGLV
jgi:phosphohistidine swiveling domain-containing protein